MKTYRITEVVVHEVSARSRNEAERKFLTRADKNKYFVEVSKREVEPKPKLAVITDGKIHYTTKYTLSGS